ncbi:MAG: DUF4105 domain-containing protein [Gemmobacter sp.]
MLFWPVLAIGGLLGGTALHVQFPQARWVVWLFVLAIVAVAVLRVVTPWGWHALAFCAVLVGGWYLTLSPRMDRDWVPELSRIVSADIDGPVVTLHDVRDFRWHDRDNGEARWRDMVVNLDQLQSADMITSVWSSPKIAHLLVSFGFADGQRVVFSVEIRREKGEFFSNIGGFFRQFELALIAATEQDIVKLRTNHRVEDVRLYPLRLTPEQLRPLFLAYLELGNHLARTPEFYNTVTANCTTVVWQLVRVLKPDLPLHRGLLLSGLLPDWLYQLGVLDGDGDLDALREAARITDKARAAPDDADFSAVIRAR